MESCEQAIGHLIPQDPKPSGRPSSAVWPRQPPGSRFPNQRAILILAGWLGLFCAPPVALASPEVFDGATTSLLVEVPVEVTLEGASLRGLTAADFELYDEGIRQQILSVEEIDLARFAQETAPERNGLEDLPVVARRHFLLLFDRSYVTPVAFERARAAAARLVEEDLHPADLIGVASYSRVRGAEWLLGFTTDRTQVTRTLEELGAAQPRLASGDPLRLSVSRSSSVETPGEAELGTASGVSRASAGGTAVQATREVQAMRERSRQAEKIAEVSLLTRSLGRLANAMARVGGRKHVVFFSEGFDDQLLFGTHDAEQRDRLVRNVQDNALWLVDSSTYFGSTAALSVVDEMNQQFRRAGANVHAVDIGGLRSDGTSTGGSKGRGGLFMVADGTGGELYEGFNNLGEAMGRLLEKTRVTYVLSFAPAELEHDGSFRELEVKLRGAPRRARVSHRSSYLAPSPPDGAGGLGTQLELAQQLFDDRPGSISTELLSVPLRVPAAASVPGVASMAYVSVLVEVEGESFLAGADPAGPVQAELYLYAFEGSGELADVFTRAVELEPSQLEGRRGGSGFKFYAPLMLHPGTYTLRSLVRNARTRQTGLAVAPLTVAARSPGSPVLLPPLFPEPADSWPLVHGRRRGLARDQEPAYPFVHGDTTFLPVARPRLLAGQTVPVFLAGYGLGPPGSVVSELRDAKGHLAAKPRWRLDPAGLDGPDGLRRHLAAFEMPDVPPGDYTLHLELLGGDARRTGTVRLPLRRVDGTPSPLLSLDAPVDFGPVDPSSSETDLAEPTVRAELEVEEEDMPLDELKALYRRAFEGHGSAGRDALVAELASAEAATLGGRPERGVRRLARAQRSVASDVAARDSGAAVALLVLHHDLYLEHRAARRPWLTQHSLERVQDLARRFTESGISAGPRLVAARALASLGGYLQAAGRASGRAFFEDAASLDPANEAALLGLAAGYEKRGGPYAKAVAHLETLVASRPESREGRLRLAINLLRVSRQPGTMEVEAKRARAAGHLRRLAGGNDWIASLAAQELARLLAQVGRRAEAQELLEAAVSRRPHDQKLQVQLAFLLERGRRPEASRRLLEGLRSAAKQAAPGSMTEPPVRGHYNRWPRHALDAARRELRGTGEGTASMAGSDSKTEDPEP